MKHALLALGALLCIGCDDGKPERIAGGDEMDNFLQAVLLDGNGAPVRGAVRLRSDIDSSVLVADEHGGVAIPSGRRRWLRFTSGAGEYLLDSPMDSGVLGVLKLEPSKPLAGWISGTGALSMPGVGSANQDNGVYVFPSVPPGKVRVLLDGNDEAGALELSLGEDFLREGVHADTFFLPPIAVSYGSMKIIPESDSASCGGACPGGVWKRINLSDSAYHQNPTTYRMLAIDTTFRKDTLPVVDVGGFVVHANSVTFSVAVLGSDTRVRLFRSPGEKAQVHVQAFGPDSSGKSADPKAVRWIPVILMRHQDPLLLMDFQIVHGDALDKAGFVPASVVKVQDDACVPVSDGSGAWRCEAEWGSYLRI